MAVAETVRTDRSGRDPGGTCQSLRAVCASKCSVNDRREKLARRPVRGWVDRQMALFLKCGRAISMWPTVYSSRPARGGGRPRDRVPFAGVSWRSRPRPKSGGRWPLSRRLKRDSAAASIRAVWPHRVRGLVPSGPRGGLAIPGDMELDAADRLNIMILHIGFRVNLASKKVSFRDDGAPLGKDVQNAARAGRPGIVTVKKDARGAFQAAGAGGYQGDPSPLRE